MGGNTAGNRKDAYTWCVYIYTHIYVYTHMHIYTVYTQ